MAKDITLKSPNGEEIYYPKTVSDLVYDNETGISIKAKNDSLIDWLNDSLPTSNNEYNSISEKINGSQVFIIAGWVGINGNLGSGGYLMSDFIKVNENDCIDAYCIGSQNVSIIAVYDSNKNFLRGIAGENKLQTYTATINHNESYVRCVCSETQAENSNIIIRKKSNQLKFLHVASKTELEEVKSSISNKIDYTEKHSDILFNLPVTDRWFVDNSDGIGRTLDSFYSILNVPCSDYANIRLWSISDVASNFLMSRSIAFYDSSDNFISGVHYSSDLSVNGFVVPADATKLSITFSKNNFEIGKHILSTQKTDDKVSKVIDRDAVLEYRQIIDVPVIENNQIPYKMKRNFDLPCFSFIFDDNSDNDDDIVKLFDKYGIRCGFAFISSDDNISLKGTKYLEYQNKGYNIINHSINGTPFVDENFTYDSALQAISKSISNAEKCGFIINGFAAPSSVMSNSLLPIIRQFHSYACLYTNEANDKNTDVCKLSRTSLHGNSLDNLKTLIDSTIERNEFIIFYSHSADFGNTFEAANNEEWNISKLEEVVKYLINKRNSGKCIINTPDFCMKQYYHLV